MTVLLILSCRVQCLTLERDTIILDGIKIEVQVQEVEESDVSADGIDTLVGRLEKKDLNLVFQLNGGISLSKFKSQTNLVTINELIDKKRTLSSFLSVQGSFRCMDSKKVDLYAGIGASFWSHSYKKVNQEIEGNLLSVYSENSGSLNAVIFRQTDVGGEPDSLKISLVNEGLKLFHLDFPFALKAPLRKSKKNRLYICLSAIPSVIYSSSEEVIEFTDGEGIQEIQFLESNITTFNFSGQAELMLSKKFNEKMEVNSSLGFRRNFSTLLSESNLLNISSNSFFLGVSASFYFHRGQ